MPLVTIGVFCFNQRSFLMECLRSVVDQDYPELEVVLVDDGSTDGSAAQLESAARANPGWRLIGDGRNVGFSRRIQQAVDSANGVWLIWVAADDALERGSITALVEGVAEGVDVVFGNLAVMDEESTSAGYVRPGDTWQGDTARKYLVPGNPTNDLFRVNNFVPGGMTLIRRSAVVAVGGYPPDIRPEDLNMWLTLGRSAQFRYIDRTVGRYRVVKGSGSRTEPFAVRNQTQMARLQLSRGMVQRSGIARLIAMRWWLSVARSRGRPPYSLRQLAQMTGLANRELLKELPRAGLDPVVLSAQAKVRAAFGRRARRT